MIINGTTVYMPFDSHQEFENIMTTNVENDQELDSYDNNDDDDKTLITKETKFNNYPQTATNNCRRMIDWKNNFKLKGIKKEHLELANKMVNQCIIGLLKLLKMFNNVKKTITKKN